MERMESGDDALEETQQLGEGIGALDRLGARHDPGFGANHDGQEPP